MKILVTGGAGFIGSHLCLRLVNEGHTVTVIDNLLLGREVFLELCRASKNFRFIKEDLLNLEAIVPLIKGHDLVYHLAANSDISQGAEKSDVDLKLGTIATYNVLEAMRKSGVKKVVFSSTSAVYGEAIQKPTPESYGPLIPISFYGASKLAAEALCTAFAHNCGMSAWIFRFANIVGSHATHGAIYDFVNRLKKDPTQLEILGDGTQKKSYLHVSDCVEGLIYGQQNSAGPVQIFNLASQGVTQVRVIAEEVVKQIGGKAKISFGRGDRGWVGDVPYTWLDGSSMYKLGWKPKFSSDEAVRRAVGEVIAESL